MSELNILKHPYLFLIVAVVLILFGTIIMIKFSTMWGGQLNGIGIGLIVAWMLFIDKVDRD